MYPPPPGPLKSDEELLCPCPLMSARMCRVEPDWEYDDMTDARLDKEWFVELSDVCLRGWGAWKSVVMSMLEKPRSMFVRESSGCGLRFNGKEEGGEDVDDTDVFVRGCVGPVPGGGVWVLLCIIVQDETTNTAQGIEASPSSRRGNGRFSQWMKELWIKEKPRTRRGE